MLARLVIQDVVLIDKLALDLAGGLCVFTGETGAGKSILLDALGLALGARGDSALVRRGAAQAVVSAVFTGQAPAPLVALLAEQGLEADDPLILRRTLGADGKSRAFLNDQPIGVGLLRDIGDLLVDVHGQFETYGLLNPATHRALLDAFGGLEKDKAALAALFASWKTAEAALDEAQDRATRAKAEEDFLRAAAQELDDLAPVPGETDDLAARRTQLQNRDKILGLLTGVQHCLSDEGGALQKLAQAGKNLAKLTDQAPPLAETLAQIDRAAADAAEAAAAVDRFAAHVDGDPAALDRIEERLFALRAVARKHGVLPEALCDVQRDLHAKLALLDNDSVQARALSADAAAAKDSFCRAAALLHEKREKAAKKIEKAVQAELPPLKLDRARFVATVTPLDEPRWSATGQDQIVFSAATNPGATPGPLHKVASGGELARFMLALKVVLAQSATPQTLVFDEVDTGIGGATASAVGDRLARLGDKLQVLVVTHSPQVAARGNAAFCVVKDMGRAHAETHVETLSAAARIEEIARMLAGSETTPAARAAAQSLLNDATPVKRKRLLA